MQYALLPFSSGSVSVLDETFKPLPGDFRAAFEAWKNDEHGTVRSDTHPSLGDCVSAGPILVRGTSGTSEFRIYVRSSS
jgi:hypothetical protein